MVLIVRSPALASVKALVPVCVTMSAKPLGPVASASLASANVAPGVVSAVPL